MFYQAEVFVGRRPAERHIGRAGVIFNGFTQSLFYPVRSARDCLLLKTW
jgi:hypothetical protein